MRLTDKRFLIFEGFCILYSVLLMEIVDLLFGSSMLGFKLIIAYGIWKALGYIWNYI